MTPVQSSFTLLSSKPNLGRTGSGDGHRLRAKGRRWRKTDIG